MSSPLYRIRDWSEHFDKAEVKKLKSAWRWVPLPTKHDGKGYRRLIRQPNGMALYGCWCVILCVAAKCSPPGTLQDSDGPLTAEDIADKSGAPAEMIAETLRILTDSVCGICWIESVTETADQTDESGCHPATPHESSATPHESGQQDNTGQNKQDNTIQDTTGASSSKKKPRYQYWTWIKSEDLSDPSKVLAWHARVCKVKNSPLKDSDGSRINTLAAAALAVEKGDDPIRWFNSCVTSKFEFVTQAAEDAARKTLKLLRGNPLGELFGKLVESTKSVLVPDDLEDEPYDGGEGDE